MQSSAMVALRTMTMIVCLVAVPLAAVLGTTLPKVVKSAFGHREPRPTARLAKEVAVAPAKHHELAAGGTDAAAEAATSPDAPVRRDETYEPTLPRVRITGVQTLADAPSIAPEGTVEQPPIETAPLWNPSPRTASASRGRHTTRHFVPSPLPQQDSRPRRIAEAQPPSYLIRLREDGRGESLQKTVYSQPEADTDPQTADDSDGEPDLTGERLAPVERVANRGALADGEQRLRELGATYYRLEAWGDGAFYRCSCSVPITPRGRATRHFESIEAVPSQAIDAVVKQVETWRAKRAAR